MDVNGKTSISSNAASLVHSNCPTPEVSPSEHHSSNSDSVDPHSPRHSIIIPNRIFVRGFDHKVSENELWDLFSECGTVTEVNIVTSRSRVPKCYGFVTFEDPEDVRKLLIDVSGIYFKDKRLCIRQAFRKHLGSENFQRPMFSMDPVPVPCGTMYLTTSSGLPYTFHNGVAYFPSPQASPSPAELKHSAPVMVPQPCQPVYHQPGYHHYQVRCFSNHYQWNTVECPVGAGPVMYAQPEYLHHVSDGASQPLMDTSAEHFDPMLHQSYSIYPLRAERGPCFVPYHEY